MRSEPETRQLRAFVAVVEAGGFTRAARLLGVSQSTVSEAVAGLERVLGTELLVRGRRQPTPTQAGARLLPGARRVLAAVDEAVREVAEADAAARATVTVGTSESISAYVLPAVLAELRRQWPGTRYVVSTDACLAIRADVRARRLDLGLVLGTGGGAGDEESLRLARGRLVLFARPGHPLAGRRPDVGAIAASTVYLSDAAGDFFTLVQRYLTGAGYPAGRLQSSGSVEGVKRGVLADPEALGLLPAHALGQELRTGAFVEVEPEVPFAPVWLEAVWPAKTVLASRARALTERLREVELEDAAAAV